MNDIMKFGETVGGYSIPVLNEREIRAAAGILFLLMFVSVLLVFLQGSFFLLKYAVTIFLSDLLIRVFINPRYSPSLIIGRLIVRNQAPEYVGAKQKKFAWIIGVILASTIFLHLIIINAYSPITGIICLICLSFLFFESAFGICLGCKLYPVFSKKKVEYCPGEVCEIKDKKEIQKTSSLQILILIGFTIYLFFTIILFKNSFSKQPHFLFEDKTTAGINQ
jgi:Domain of unknown function (DUF4395)